MESHALMNNPSKPAIIFQDEDILVINKPPHLLSVPDGYDPHLPHIRSILQSDFDPLWMVHRLDKETSGVMILARNAEAHRTLNESFKSHKIEKTYHGLVAPVPEWREKVIDTSLQVNADRRHRTRADKQNGKQAWSKCQVMKSFPFGVLMSIEIKTGITHQIRAHLRSCDLALLGDTLYQAGLEPQPLPALRVMLHSRKISFPHPATSEIVQFTAPYPDDFRDCYTRLTFTRDLDTLI